MLHRSKLKPQVSKVSILPLVLSFFALVLICYVVGFSYVFKSNILPPLGASSIPSNTQESPPHPASENQKPYADPLDIKQNYPILLKHPNKNYPPFKNLLQIVSDWNPDDPEIPDNFVETLQHFNYSDPRERSYAEAFRNAEIPFKVYDVPDIDSVRIKWTNAYLEKNMRPNLRIEKSKDNHFMYFKSNPNNKYAGWIPPQGLVAFSFSDWLKLALQADEKMLASSEEHYYLTIGTSTKWESDFYTEG